MIPVAPSDSLTLRQPGTLDELLNYRLLRLYAASTAPVTRLMQGRFGISRREWRLLALLHAETTLSPSALAERAGLDRPRTSRAIGTLASKGLLARVTEVGDARRARVALTAAGRRLYDDAFPQVAAMNARVVAALDDATAELFDKALARLTECAIQIAAENHAGPSTERRTAGKRRGRAWQGAGG
jgi:DNA-binding MarR family transcriptional regulator